MVGQGRWRQGHRPNPPSMPGQLGNRKAVMDIGETLNFAFGLIIALVLGYLAWLEWRKGSKEERLAMVERVVLAIEQMHPELPGSDKLALVIERLRTLLPFVDLMELRELIESVVARMNLAKRAGIDAPLPRGYFTD